jgi:hypothetical protein
VERSLYCPNKISAWQIIRSSLLYSFDCFITTNYFLCFFLEGLLYKRCNKMLDRIILCGFMTLSMLPRFCTQPYHTFECVCVCVSEWVWCVCRSVQYSLTNCVHYLHCTCQLKTRDSTPFSFAVAIFSLWLWQMKLCLISLEGCDFVEKSDWFCWVWDVLVFFQGYDHTTYLSKTRNSMSTVF